MKFVKFALYFIAFKPKVGQILNNKIKNFKLVIIKIYYINKYI